MAGIGSVGNVGAGVAPPWYSQLASGLGNNSNLLLGLSSGLLSGDLSKIPQGIAAGAQQDDAYATATKENADRLAAINQTEQFLHAKGFDDLVPLVKAGQGGAALTEAFKRMAPQDPQAPIKASPGDIFLDPKTYQPISTIPPAPEKPTGTQQEYNQAVAQGFKGTILDYQTALKNGSAGATTAPDGTPLPVVTMTDDGRVDPDQQAALLSALPPNDATLVKAIANYEIDPAKVASMRGGGGGGNSERQRLVTLAKQYDPTYDGTQFAVRAQTRKLFTTGTAAQNLTSANTLIGHLNELATNSTALGNGDFTPFNVIKNTTGGLTGATQPTTYSTAAQAVADEMAKVFKGSGASDVQSIQDWQKRVDVNASPGQQKAFITEAVKLLASRVAALRDQYQSATGKPADFKFLSDKAAQTLTNLGFDPTEVDPNYGNPNATLVTEPGTPSGPTVGSTGDPALDDALKKYGG